MQFFTKPHKNCLFSEGKKRMKTHQLTEESFTEKYKLFLFNTIISLNFCTKERAHLQSIETST